MDIPKLAEENPDILRHMDPLLLAQHYPILISASRSGFHFLATLCEAYFDRGTLIHNIYQPPEVHNYLFLHRHDNDGKALPLSLVNQPVLFLHRNTYDVVYSRYCYDKYQQLNDETVYRRFPKDPAHAKKLLIDHLEHLDKWQNCDKVKCRISYESLVNETDLEFKKVVKFFTGNDLVDQEKLNFAKSVATKSQIASNENTKRFAEQNPLMEKEEYAINRENFKKWIKSTL